MPKSQLKIEAFHGGLNDNSDPKDILDIELRKADGVSTSRVGRLVSAGNIGTPLTSINDITNTSKKGCGLYFFSTDRDSSEGLTGEDWLALYDSANDSNVIKLYYRDKDGSTPNFYTSGAISFGNNTTKANPSFYFADGGLRVSDADFNHNSKYHAYINHNLFQRSKVITDEVLFINKWINVEQELKSFEDLSVTLETFDASSAGPGTSQITAVNLASAGKIVLAYWTDDDGDWNGSYEIAAAPIYKGNQEGMITVLSDTLNFYENQVVFQVYVCLGQQDNSFSNFSDDEAHPLQDDRITGINWYFRGGADDDWIFLQETDLLEGGKNYWAVYNADDQTAYGFFSGTVSIVDGNNDLALANTTGSNGSKTAPSFATTNLTVTVTNNNSNGFTGRTGFIRVWGGNTDPVWLNTKSNGDPVDLSTGTYTVPIVTPADGTREFKAELLDENFTVIAESAKKTISITDSGSKPPPDYVYERSA